MRFGLTSSVAHARGTTARDRQSFNPTAVAETTDDMRRKWRFIGAEAQSTISLVAQRRKASSSWWRDAYGYADSSGATIERLAYLTTAIRGHHRRQAPPHCYHTTCNCLAAR
jgi:hypothetical protein